VIVQESLESFECPDLGNVEVAERLHAGWASSRASSSRIAAATTWRAVAV
jgi:hypothetical protein